MAIDTDFLMHHHLDFHGSYFHRRPCLADRLLNLQPLSYVDVVEFVFAFVGLLLHLPHLASLFVLEKGTVRDESFLPARILRAIVSGGAIGASTDIEVFTGSTELALL